MGLGKQRSILLAFIVVFLAALTTGVLLLVASSVAQAEEHWDTDTTATVLSYYNGMAMEDGTNDDVVLFGVSSASGWKVGEVSGEWSDAYMRALDTEESSGIFMPDSDGGVHVYASGSDGNWASVDDTSLLSYSANVAFGKLTIDLSEVERIELSEELKRQLKEEVEKMELNLSLSWGTWVMIFALAVIAAKMAHRITLRTIFKPTKWAARKAEEVAKETAETVKKEWEES